MLQNLHPKVFHCGSEGRILGCPRCVSYWQLLGNFQKSRPKARKAQGLGICFQRFGLRLKGISRMGNQKVQELSQKIPCPPYARYERKNQGGGCSQAPPCRAQLSRLAAWGTLEDTAHIRAGFPRELCRKHSLHQHWVSPGPRSSQTSKGSRDRGQRAGDPWRTLSTSFQSVMF